MSPSNTAKPRHDSSAVNHQAPRAVEASSLERTLAELNQIQRSMGVGARRYWVPSIILPTETRHHFSRD